MVSSGSLIGLSGFVTVTECHDTGTHRWTGHVQSTLLITTADITTIRE